MNSKQNELNEIAMLLDEKLVELQENNDLPSAYHLQHTIDKLKHYIREIEDKQQAKTK